MFCDKSIDAILFSERSRVVRFLFCDKSIDDILLSDKFSEVRFLKYLMTLASLMFSSDKLIFSNSRISSVMVKTPSTSSSSSSSMSLFSSHLSFISTLNSSEEQLTINKRTVKVKKGISF